MNKQMRSLLGLCQKAGLSVSGEFSCEKALQGAEAQLVLIATDASDNTKKKFTNKAFYYNVPSYLYSDKTKLSEAIGKTNRAVIVVINKGFAEKIVKHIDNERHDVDA